MACAQLQIIGTGRLQEHAATAPLGDNAHPSHMHLIATKAGKGRMLLDSACPRCGSFLPHAEGAIVLGNFEGFKDAQGLHVRAVYAGHA